MHSWHYLSRAGLKKSIDHRLFWGSTTTTTLVENYPGFENGIDGNELSSQTPSRTVWHRNDSDLFKNWRRIVSFLEVHNGEIIDTKVVSHRNRCPSAKYLGDWRRRSHRKGVSACMTCDAFLLIKREILVVGGRYEEVWHALHRKWPFSTAAMSWRIWILYKRAQQW